MEGNLRAGEEGLKGLHRVKRRGGQEDRTLTTQRQRSIAGAISGDGLFAVARKITGLTESTVTECSTLFPKTRPELKQMTLFPFYSQ